MDISLPFYGFNRTGAKVSEGLRSWYVTQGSMAGIKSVYDCIEQFSETDFTEDLKKFDIPTLIMHGDDDQIVPIGTSALMTSKLVPNAELKIYKGASHGMAQIIPDLINNDLLKFIKSPHQQKKIA